MDSFLLYADKSMAGEAMYPSFQDVYKDLNLNIVLKTMSRDDAFMMEQIRQVIMTPVHDADTIMYRYDIIKDFWCHGNLLDELFSCAKSCAKIAEQYRREMDQNRNKVSAKTSSLIVSLRFIQDAIALFIAIKQSLIKEIQSSEQPIYSNGLLSFYNRLCSYPIEEMELLHNKIMFYLTGGEGIFSVKLSGGLKLDSSSLLNCNNFKAAPTGSTARKMKKIYYKIIKKDTILVEDDALEKDIKSFVESNVLLVMDFYAPWIADCSAFLYDFSREITFYKGINNFQKRMKELDLPLCYGEVCKDKGQKKIEELYELSLALYVQVYPVTNDFIYEKSVLTIITGANQGGKSTFLRSLGIAQILFQAGIPVPAKTFCSNLYSRIHTHFTRKEDAMLSRGRLEEELKRMNRIISELAKDSLLLLNESFASTTEKEGSVIAENIIVPLYEKNIEVMMVTHLHEFARNMYNKNFAGTSFLVAERQEDGTRTYKIIEGKPHYSSYGTDLYKYVLE